MKLNIICINYNLVCFFCIMKVACGERSKMIMKCMEGQSYDEGQEMEASRHGRDGGDVVGDLQGKRGLSE